MSSSAVHFIPIRTELVGLLLTWTGYRMSVRPSTPPVPARAVATT